MSGHLKWQTLLEKDAFLSRVVPAAEIGLLNGTSLRLQPSLASDLLFDEAHILDNLVVDLFALVALFVHFRAAGAFRTRYIRFDLLAVSYVLVHRWLFLLYFNRRILLLSQSNWLFLMRYKNTLSGHLVILFLL